ncbi:MAG TPA: hypothetical protein V6C97_02060 [Oculatellaceae cyanobacterium]
MKMWPAALAVRQRASLVKTRMDESGYRCQAAGVCVCGLRNGNAH